MKVGSLNLDNLDILHMCMNRNVLSIVGDNGEDNFLSTGGHIVNCKVNCAFDWFRINWLPVASGP